MRFETGAGGVVLASLLAAVQRGVDVRLLYNVAHPGPIPVPPPPETAPEAIEALPVATRGIAGIPDLMHHKFVVRDREAVWTGSTNWTDDSWSRQENVIAIVRSPEIAYAYTLAFEQLWERGNVEGTGRVDPRPEEVDGARVRAWFCPGHGEALSHRVAKFIGNARERVRIASPVLTSGPILATLVEVVNEGRSDVAGVVDDTQIDQVFHQWRTNGVSAWKIPLLRTVITGGSFSGKVSIPWTPESVHDFMHAKVVVADDTAFLGSFNFSRSGEQNAEDVLEIRHAAIADRLATFVDEIRARYPRCDSTRRDTGTKPLDLGPDATVRSERNAYRHVTYRSKKNNASVSDFARIPQGGPEVRGLLIIVAGGAIVAGLIGSTAFAGTDAKPEPREGITRADLRGVNFIESCRFSHAASDDPIVFPGKAGASHNHSFVGNRTTSASSTYASLRAGATSCEREADTAAYWVPTLYEGANAVLPMGATIYYRRGTLDQVHTFPNNLRMIAGDQTATSPQGRRVTFWNCGVNGGVEPSSTVPTCPDQRGSFLRLHIAFPNCWNGRSLDSADHKSHMAYALRGAELPLDASGLGTGDRAHLPLPDPRRRGLLPCLRRPAQRARRFRERVAPGQSEEARRGLPERPRPLRQGLERLEQPERAPADRSRRRPSPRRRRIGAAPRAAGRDRVGARSLRRGRSSSPPRGARSGSPPRSRRSPRRRADRCARWRASSRLGSVVRRRGRGSPSPRPG